MCQLYKDILHAELMRDEHLNSNLQGQLVFLGTQNASSDFFNDLWDWYSTVYYKEMH